MNFNQHSHRRDQLEIGQTRYTYMHMKIIIIKLRVRIMSLRVKAGV